MDLNRSAATETETYWEKVAQTTWGSYITQVEKRVLPKAHDLSKRPGVALEVGCEGGRWSLLLANLGWHMICTDIDPRVLAICQRRIPQAQCILVNGEDEVLPCDSNSLTLLLCIEVINAYPVMARHRFLSEAYRALRRDGLLVGTLTNRLSLRGYFSRLVSFVRGAPDSSYAVSYRGRRNILGRQGFRMIHQEGICWFPFGRASNSPLVPLCTRAEHYAGLRRLPTVSPIIVFWAQKN